MSVGTLKIRRTQLAKNLLCPTGVGGIDTTIEKGTKSLGVTWEPVVKLLYVRYRPLTEKGGA